MDTTPLTHQVRTAHGDAWQVQGRLRVPQGGGQDELPGIRLMASGLQHAQWNNGDVTDATLVDIEKVRAWYRSRGVPWGVRVPLAMPWPHGRHLFVKRLMGCTATAFKPSAAPSGCVLRRAGMADLGAVVGVDSVAFDSEPSVEKPWLAPHLTSEATTVALALQDGEPVATAYSLRSNGRAGPSVYVAGVAVLPEARGRGIGGAISSWLIQRALTRGDQLAHLHPNTDAAAAIYERLGFEEVGGLDVYVDN